MLHQTECEICLDVATLNDMHFGPQTEILHKLIGW